MAGTELGDARLLEDAYALMLGMVTARHGQKAQDSQALIASYMSESAGRGISPEASWAILFSAGVLWVDVLVQCRAEHHGQSHQETVQELSLLLLGGRP
jgi:hypothetical protein